MNGFLVTPYVLLENLTMSEAWILSMVYSLSKSFGSCKMSNKRMGERSHLSSRRVSQILSDLHFKGYVDFEEKNGKRSIRVTKSVDDLFRRELQKGSNVDTSVDWFKDYLKDG